MIEDTDRFNVHQTNKGEYAKIQGQVETQLQKLKELQGTIEQRIAEMRKAHEDTQRNIQQSIKEAVERGTSNKMNEISDKVANKFSSQIVNMISTIIGTRESDSNTYINNEFKTDNDTNKTGYKNKTETLRAKDSQKYNSKLGNSRTQDMLDALPRIDQKDYNLSSNHDNNQ